MPISRRSFLTKAAASTFLPAILPGMEALRPADQSAMPDSSTSTIGEKYWSNLYDTGKRAGRPVFGDELRDPRFAFFDDHSGLRWIEDNKPDMLPFFNDDAVVTLELGGFRTGKVDEPKLRRVRFAQMHLSCQQVKGSDFIGPLAWAALATVFADKAKQLPSVPEVSAITGPSVQTMPGAPQLNRVLLPEGAGHLSVNITTTPTASILDKILSTTIKITKIVTPLLGFPAISVPALSAFSAFYGTLEKAEAGNFLLNTALKDVVVTQKGTADPHVSAKRFCLLSGYYVLVPQSQQNLLAGEMPNLMIQNGYLIQRKDAGSTSPIDSRIKNAVPELTYITLHVDVKPASAFNSKAS